jgi:hypothetical protein
MSQSPTQTPYKCVCVSGVSGVSGFLTPPSQKPQIPQKPRHPHPPEPVRSGRPAYLLHLELLPGRDERVALRGLLKRCLRDWGWRAITVTPAPPCRPETVQTDTVNHPVTREEPAP